MLPLGYRGDRLGELVARVLDFALDFLCVSSAIAGYAGCESQRHLDYGGERRSQPVEEIPAICVLDAGNTGFVIKAEHVLKEGRTHMMAGPQAHWAKLAFERYFIETRKRGFVKV